MIDHTIRFFSSPLGRHGGRGGGSGQNGAVPRLARLLKDLVLSDHTINVISPPAATELESGELSLRAWMPNGSSTRLQSIKVSLMD